MALFEGYERRIDKINAVLKEYGISSVEECRDICLAKGIDCDKIVRAGQPICFENAVWAYTVGSAIAIKKGCRRHPTRLLQSVSVCRRSVFLVRLLKTVWLVLDTATLVQNCSLTKPNVSVSWQVTNLSLLLKAQFPLL